MDERDDWVADVRRWCTANREVPVPGLSDRMATQEAEVGYEAAHPVLQSRYWPDAPRSEFGASPA